LLIRELRGGGEMDHQDVMRRLLESALQDLVDQEATLMIGADRYQRCDQRVTHRNGTRPKRLATPAGEVDLLLPKLREGSFFPSLLDPRRRVDQALWAVIAQAWVEGTSTRKVTQLVKALGNDTGISKSSVSRVCQQLDEAGRVFLDRPLSDTWYPYLWLDATYVHARIGHRVVSQAVVVATGVSIEGRREILGMGVGDSETTDCWTGFLRCLRERGLQVPTPADPRGVALVVSDAHEGLKTAIAAILPGAAWQRCRVHFARNVTSRLGSHRSKPVNALIGTIFAQTTPEAVTACYHHVSASLAGAFPEIADMLDQAEPDLTAFATMPPEHWRKIWSNNPIERLNREIKRRTDVVQVFPDKTSVTRLIGTILAEQHEEWQYGERRYLSEISMRRLLHTLHNTDQPATRPLSLAA
jgi:transposase-like protein